MWRVKKPDELLKVTVVSNNVDARNKLSLKATIQISVILRAICSQNH